MFSRYYYPVFFRIFFFIIFFSTQIFPHGFRYDTAVLLEDGITRSIGDIAQQTLIGTQTHVLGYHTQKHTISLNQVLTPTRSLKNVYYRIQFDEHPHNDIYCSPTQLFYSLPARKWTHACNLQPGDCLAAAYEKQVHIIAIERIDKPVELHTISVHRVHTFFAGNYHVLVHNFAVVLGISVALDWCGVFLGTKGAIGAINISG